MVALPLFDTKPLVMALNKNLLLFIPTLNAALTTVNKIGQTHDNLKLNEYTYYTI